MIEDEISVMYDYQILAMQKYGGISRYYYELASGMKEKGVDVHIPVIFSKNEYFKTLIKHPVVSPDLRFIRGVTRISNLISKMHRRNAFDIIHPTYYDPYLIGAYEGKLVVTVYDMIHEQFMSEDVETIKRKKEYIYKSNRIIAISNQTKNDILRIYPDIDENKIVVTYLSDSVRERSDAEISKLPNRYILFTGNRSGYKNFSNFIIGISELIINNRDLYIVCGGGGAFTKNEIELLDKLKIKSQVIQVEYNENEIYTLYNKALCFVFPSLYEGFGIPLLEAMRAQCPVICSNASCFPEIGEDAVLYFDGENPDDIRQKVLDCIRNRELQEELVRKGGDRAINFSWDKTVKQTLNIYKELKKI